MEQFIIGGIITVVGLTVIIFRKKFIEAVIKVNNEGLGFMHYGERERKIGMWQVPVFGIIFILWGILTMLGVLN